MASKMNSPKGHNERANRGSKVEQQPVHHVETARDGTSGQYAKASQPTARPKVYRKARG